MGGRRGRVGLIFASPLAAVGSVVHIALGGSVGSSGKIITPATIGAVPTARTITAGTGLTGGGDFSSDLTMSVANGALSMAGLRRALVDGSRSVAIGVLGDSTGNDITEWPYLFANYISSQYPAWTVQTRLWSDAMQTYDSAATVQTGTAGVRYLDGSTGSATRSMAASMSPHLSGTIDVRVKMSLVDWTPASQVNVTGRSGVAGTRGWYVIISTSGVPVFAYSVDGTTVSTMSATAALGATDGSTLWIRWLFTPDDLSGNRVLKCYYGSNGYTWTQLGTTVTTAGSVTLHDPGLGYEVGGIASFANSSLKVYEVEIRDGDTGPLVAPAIPDLWQPYSSSAAYFVGSPVLTVVNGSHPGANIAYLGDAVRLPKLMPNYGQVVQFLSSSHNEARATGREWVALYSDWAAAVRSELPGTPLLVLTQNPEKSASTWSAEHARRRVELCAMHQSLNADVVDTYKDFIDYGDWSTDLMTDNVHPNTAGSAILASAVESIFSAS